MNKREAYARLKREIDFDEKLRKVVFLLTRSHTETYVHSIQVALLTAMMCDALKYDDAKTSMLVRSAIAHDIGKIEIDKAILNKTTSLSEKERKIMEKHPVIGAKMARKMGFEKEVEQRIYLHHWKPNRGEGYPVAVVKDEELISDIELLALCDVYSAIVQPRSYRDAYSSDYALKEVEREDVDIKLIVAFKKIVKENEDLCFSMFDLSID